LNAFQKCVYLEKILNLCFLKYFFNYFDILILKIKKNIIIYFEENIFFTPHETRFKSITAPMCEDLCSQICNCKGFQKQIQKVLLSTKHSLFYPKSGLLNGHNSVNFDGHFYLKVAKTSLFSNRTVEEFSLGCSISKLSNL
jgi:hypothetical protein